MKWFILLLVLLVLGTGVYAYKENPDGCAKFGTDLQTAMKAELPGLAADVVTIFSSDKAAPDSKTPKTAPSSTNGTATPNSPTPKAAPSSTDATPTAHDMSPVTATAPAWTPPAKIPSQPNWTWTTSQGTFTWVHILKVEADRVTILHMQGQAVVPMSELSPDLQKQLNYNPAAALAAANQRKGDGSAVAQAPEAQPAIQTASASPVVSQGAGFPGRFSGSLVTMQGGDFATFDSSHLKNVKYWAFYYSASWCPPCRAFTPKLVQFYSTFKSQHPNFELIFVNEDHNEADMLAYMKEDFMTWPAVRYSDIGLTNATQYCGSGIPDLVLLDSDGKVLSDSFNGSEYVGPEKVMDDIPRMVTAN